MRFRCTRRVVTRPHDLNGRLRLELLETRTLPSTFVVNNLGDTGSGKRLFGDLRYCIGRANEQPGEDLIIFEVEGTINLTKALPNILHDLIIAGPGADRLTIRRDTGGNYRIFTLN